MSSIPACAAVLVQTQPMALSKTLSQKPKVSTELGLSLSGGALG